MDDIISYLDRNYLTPHVYSESWKEDDLFRQILTLSVLSVFGSFLVYLIPATVAYYLWFDKRLLLHKKILPGQIQQEIAMALKAVPIMGLITVPFFILDIRGHTKLYESYKDQPLSVVVLQFIGFVCWNDCLVYWVHRALHLKWVYKRLHKPHHKWLIPTPFASHAFNPLDGWAQSLPYHFYILLVPMPKWLWFGSFSVLNLWTTSIHDEWFCVPDRFYLREIINGAAHHTDHHLFFNYNHGLYFTLWDRIGGTYRKPSSYSGQGPFQDLGLKID